MGLEQAPERALNGPPRPPRPGARALRIALVAPPYLPVPPPGYGGIERVVGLLADGLAALGHDVTLFASPDSATAARLVSPLGERAVLGDPASVAAELYHVASAYLAAESFDIVHDHTGLGPALGAMHRRRPAVVHTLHGPWTPPAQRLAALFESRLHYVAISDAQRRANPGLRYAATVHNGVDLSAHRFQPAKEDYLVFVGRSNPEKRPEVAIDVARRAGLPLVMIVKRTEPFERRYFAEVVEPRLGPDVVVRDEPPEDEKVDLVGRARALVFPIDWPEPFGLVMIEALACGTPVVAPPYGAVTEVVRDGLTGFVSESVDEMAAAVDACRDLDPAACRADVETRFSGTAMVRAYERLYRSLVARSRRHAPRRTTTSRVAALPANGSAERSL